MTEYENSQSDDQLEELLMLTEQMQEEMIAHTLPGHLVSDLTVGAAQQVVGEDRPYKLCFLRLAVDPAVLNLIAERYFSLPSHLSHHPLYVF